MIGGDYLNHDFGRLKRLIRKNKINKNFETNNFNPFNPIIYPNHRSDI